MFMGSSLSLFSHFIPMFCFSLAALQFSSSRIRHEYSSFNTDSLTNSHNSARAYSSSKLCEYIYLYSVCMSIYLSTYLSTYLVYLSLYIISPSSPNCIYQSQTSRVSRSFCFRILVLSDFDYYNLLPWSFCFQSFTSSKHSLLL